MKEKRTGTKWFYWFTFAVSIIAIYKLLDNFTDIKIWLANFLNVIMPFIIGIIIAYILYTPSRNLEHLICKLKKPKFIKNKARTISVIIVYLITLLILTLAINYLIPIITESVTDFISHFQEYYTIITTQINELPDDSFLKSETVTNSLTQLGNVDISEYINIQKLTQYAQGALSFASGIFKFFVSIIVSIYLLLERGEIVKFFKKFTKSAFEKGTAQKIGKYFNNTNEIFLKFLASQLLDAIIVGILTSIAMKIIGVKYAVLLGFMIGLFNMIPYFGAIVAVIIATLITFITGGLSQAIWMVIIILILQQIDANIINPKIVGDSLKISPLLVIFSVTIGGAYFGILGMFLAVPVSAMIKLLIEDYIELKELKEQKEQKEQKE